SYHAKNRVPMRISSSFALFFVPNGVTDAFRAMFKAQAERQVKTRLALQKVADLENIAVTEQEIADEYAKMAEQYKMDVEKIKTIVAQDALSGDLRISNALEFIKANAKVKKASKKKAEETEETAE
ncbi:MAG: hypothetical protein EGP70_01470, partial [Butyricicoccus sp.]|nr:hypothetical protein [Butyricicoccus sp.]